MQRVREIREGLLVLFLMSVLVPGCHWIWPFDGQRSLDRGPSDRLIELDERPILDIGLDATQDGSRRDTLDSAPPLLDGGCVHGTWVPIQAGAFTMGSTANSLCFQPNEVLHDVILTHGFEIQETEVTQGQFQTLMGYISPDTNTTCGSDCPVENVTWHEAAAYCNALSEKCKLDLCYACSGTHSSVVCKETYMYSGAAFYSCKGYRLPTEAEWEYAYRAGTDTSFYNNGSIFSCADDVDTFVDQIGWYSQNSSKTIHPAHKKQPNSWRLYDMAGNVSEWCQDWFHSVLGEALVTDPNMGEVLDGVTSSWRVARGGSYSHAARYLRGASRVEIAPGQRLVNLGFRCARTLFP